VPILDDVDNEQPRRPLSRIGASMPPPHRLQDEVAWPISLALTGLGVRHAQASRQAVTLSRIRMLVLQQVQPRGNLEDGRHQFRVLARQYDLLPTRRSRRGEQLPDSNFRLLLRAGR
jgi:hypothetical protein